MIKYYETYFEDYINECKKINIHSKLELIYNSFSKNIEELPNIIFYGPKGSGKYTQVLYFLSLYTNLPLKYKKAYISYNKQEYFFKISDVHYEIDMSTLGCNSKLLWQEIYSYFVDLINSKPDKIGFLVLKNFHEIHNELLDIFYSYIQKYLFKKNNIRFIFITEHISFIPDSIINICNIINIEKPSKKTYQKLVMNKSKNNLNNKYLNFENVTNIKLLYLNYFDNISDNDELIESHTVQCQNDESNFYLINDNATNSFVEKSEQSVENKMAFLSNLKYDQKVKKENENEAKKSLPKENNILNCKKMNNSLHDYNLSYMENNKNIHNINLYSTKKKSTISLKENPICSESKRAKTFSPTDCVSLYQENNENTYQSSRIDVKKMEIKNKEKQYSDINICVKKFDNISIKHKFLCDKIITYLLKGNKINLIEFRILLYNIFIYSHNLYECVWYILEKLQEKIKKKTDISFILLNTYNFFKYYNNNYRPIYHLEKYFLYLINYL